MGTWTPPVVVEVGFEALCARYTEIRTRLAQEVDRGMGMIEVSSN